MANKKATVLSGGIALQSSGLPEGVDGGVPEWIQILPIGEMKTTDGRGPYSMKNAEAVLQASLDSAGGRLVLDENHATDAKAPGVAARAAGWIVGLAARSDGVWARVEWTAFGEKLVINKSYRGVSPVIVHNGAGEINMILRAALTNKPNLLGMTALHNQNQPETETIMDLSALIELLGLDQGATEEDVTAAIKALSDAKEPDGDEAAVQSALADIAKKLGDDVAADTTAICSAIDVALDGTTSVGEMKAMQSQMVDMLKATAKARAEAVVGKAIDEMRVGVSPLRDHFIARHMASPDGAKAVEKELAGLPCMENGGSFDGKMSIKGSDKDGLTAADKAVISALGTDPAAYKKTLAAEAAKQEAL